MGTYKVRSSLDLLFRGESKCPNTPPIGIRKSKMKKIALHPVATGLSTVDMVTASVMDAVFVSLSRVGNNACTW